MGAESSHSSGGRSRYHLVLATPFDLAGMEARAAAGKSPRHFLYRVQRQLDAAVHAPGDAEPTLVDRLGARLICSPAVWALARRLARQLRDGDVVFAYDNDGLLISGLCALRRRRVRMTLSVMSPERLRFRLAMRLVRGNRRIEHFGVNTRRKAAFLADRLGVPADRVHVGRDQTDTSFFTPGPRATLARPMLFAAGREQRDYRTLAEATRDLDIDVRVCAASPNASSKMPVAYPDPVPANMTFGPYPWPEFRQAYRDADVVVVPLLDHDYAAGMTVVMEALACRRPVVATVTEGSMQEMVDGGYVVGVPPGDALAMRKAIVGLLEDPAAAERLAERGYRKVLADHTSDRAVAGMVASLRALAG